MEKFKFVLLVLLTAATLLIVTGFSNSSNPLNSGNAGNDTANTGNQVNVTVNGDGFNHIQLNAADGAAYYSSYENLTYTSIVAKAGTDTLLILLSIAGKETGTFEWNDSEATSYLVIPNDGYTSYTSVNSGSTTITEFGGINGFVKGSFSGSVYKSETNEPVDIEGTFSIKRIEDK